MNKLLTAAAVAAFLTSPVFAQQAGPEMGLGPTTYPMPPQAMSDVEPEGASAYASSPAAGAVVIDGVMVGADPDANIRLQLRRDQSNDTN